MRPPLRLDRASLIAWGLFGLALGVYVSGLPPSITWRHAAADSGELAAAVETWGVPHPPGYPTYILAGRLFSLLPFGEVAYRLNLMSALAGAAAVALAFRSALVLLRLVSEPGRGASAGAGAGRGLAGSGAREAAAAAGALSLAFAPVFWGQAMVAEVYAPSAFFAALSTYLLLSWLEAVERRGRPPSALRPVAAAFVLGLGMGSHYMVAGVALPLAAAALWRARGRARIPWPALALAAVAGLGVFVYLPVSASRHPPVNWGDPSSLSGFLWNVTARPYRGYVYGIDLGLWDNRLGDWAKQMVDQYQGVGVVLGLAGFWRLWRWDRVFAGALGLSFLGLCSYATFYLASDSFVFLVPALFVGSLAVAAGAYAVMAAVPRAWDARRAALAGALAAIGIVALVPGVSLARNYGDLDLSGDREARDFGPAVLSSVPPDAVVLTDTDQPLFSLWYYRFVVDTGPGATVVARNLLQYDWYVDTLRHRHPGLAPPGLSGPFAGVVKGLVEKLLAEGRPVYTTFQDPLLQAAYLLIPEGLVYRVAPLASAGADAEGERAG